MIVYVILGLCLALGASETGWFNNQSAKPSFPTKGAELLLLTGAVATAIAVGPMLALVLSGLRHDGRRRAAG